MDVFALDAMTEMLQSPLQFLSFVNRRANYAEQLLAAQELTILGYHLKQNLWVQSGADLIHLDDDFSAGLDIAMAVRRTGVEGEATPDGILTRLRAMTIGRIVEEIGANPEPVMIDLGCQLLSLSEDAAQEMSQVIDKLAARTRTDGKVHDATFGFSGEGRGITFHCTDEPLPVAGPRLQTYCKSRKYKERAKEWFGFCLSSWDSHVRYGVSLSYPWVQDSAMDEATNGMRAQLPIDRGLAMVLHGKSGTTKVGRNDPCPCGSGRKYKKCCLG